MQIGCPSLDPGERIEIADLMEETMHYGNGLSAFALLWTAANLRSNPVFGCAVDAVPAAPATPALERCGGHAIACPIALQSPASPMSGELPHPGAG
jgi:hypothetical protein